jgi:hypothetical protein
MENIDELMSIPSFLTTDQDDRVTGHGRINTCTRLAAASEANSLDGAQ